MHLFYIFISINLLSLLWLLGQAQEIMQHCRNKSQLSILPLDTEHTQNTDNLENLFSSEMFLSLINYYQAGSWFLPIRTLISRGRRENIFIFIFCLLSVQIWHINDVFLAICMHLARKIISLFNKAEVTGLLQSMSSFDLLAVLALTQCWGLKHEPLAWELFSTLPINPQPSHDLDVGFLWGLTLWMVRSRSPSGLYIPSTGTCLLCRGRCRRSSWPPPAALECSHTPSSGRLCKWARTAASHRAGGRRSTGDRYQLVAWPNDVNIVFRLLFSPDYLRLICVVMSLMEFCCSLFETFGLFFFCCCFFCYRFLKCVFQGHILSNVSHFFSTFQLW